MNTPQKFESEKQLRTMTKTMTERWPFFLVSATESAKMFPLLVRNYSFFIAAAAFSSAAACCAISATASFQSLAHFMSTNTKPSGTMGTHKKRWPFQPRPFADTIGLVRCYTYLIRRRPWIPAHATKRNRSLVDHSRKVIGFLVLWFSAWTPLLSVLKDVSWSQAINCIFRCRWNVFALEKLKRVKNVPALERLPALIAAARASIPGRCNISLHNIILHATWDTSLCITLFLWSSFSPPETHRFFVGG